MDNEKTANLQRQITLFQAIIDHANAVIGAKDVDGQYIFVNEEYSRLFHIDQSKFIGQTDFDIFPTEVAKLFREADLKVIAKNDVIVVEEKAPVDGQMRDYLSVKFPIRDEDGVLFATGLVATDISKRKKDEAKIYKMAYTDQLTDISNRTHFNQRFDETIKLATRENKKLALLMIDLDDFKPVNDSYGHQIGDKLLHKISSIFKKVSRDTDIVARLGGDEFAIILVHPDNKEEITLIAQRVIDEVKKPILISEHHIQIGVSIGVSVFPDDDDDKEKLIKKADMALYEAKNNGRNTFRLYKTSYNNRFI